MASRFPAPQRPTDLCFRPNYRKELAERGLNLSAAVLHAALDAVALALFGRVAGGQFTNICRKPRVLSITDVRSRLVPLHLCYDHSLGILGNRLIAVVLWAAFGLGGWSLRR